MAGRRARLGHRDLAAHPRPGLVDGMARPQIIGPHRLEERQYVLRAVGRPLSKKSVMRV
jgi:hypothetical protein